MNIVTKDFPVTIGETSPEFPNGSFEVILSAPTLDRDGEVVDAKAFEPLPAHITFDTDHSMTVDSVVGSGVPYYAADGTLRVKGSFCADPRSQVVRQKVTDGHIRTTSVTFLDAERETDEKGVHHVKRAELLNGTFTPVPSNRESIVLTAKSIVAKEGRRNNASDSQLIQTLHDTSVSLGADCAGMTKSVKAVSDKPWSQFSASDYSLEQYQRACLISGPTKGDCHLPVREPDGTLNRNAVHAAASALAGGRGGVQLSPEDHRRAARGLLRLYSQLGEKPPDSLTQAAKSVTKAVGDSDSDPGSLAQATDAAIDNALALLTSLDESTLPAEVQQAIALVQAADESVDSLMALLGVPDPDPETDQNADAESVTKSAVDAAAEAAAAAADEAAASAAPTAAETADEKSTLMARLAGLEHTLAL